MNRVKGEVISIIQTVSPEQAQGKVRDIYSSFFKFTPMQISAAKPNPDLASLPPNEKALLKFVLKAVQDPALTGQNDIDALCEQGWSHQVIFEAVFLGRLMIVMGMMMKTFKMSED